MTEKKKRSNGRKVGEVGMEKKTNERKKFELPTAEVYKVRKGKNGMSRARAGSGEEKERDMQICSTLYLDPYIMSAPSLFNYCKFMNILALFGML